MACIDADGNLTRTAELILLALRRAAVAEEVAAETDLPLFRVRGAIRELQRAGLLAALGDQRFQTTDRGIGKLEG
jgi:predicted transcriptional regulator